METIKKLSLLLIVSSLLLSSCGLGGGATGTDDGTGLPEPQITTNNAPDVEQAVRNYLDAWDENDYASMYSSLSTLSRDSVSYEEFEARYQNVTTQANIFEVEYEILQTLVNPKSAQVGYRVTLHSAVIGPITRETTMDLSLEGSDWRIAWDDRLILPELAGGNTLSMERFEPARGDIYDQNGDVLASTVEAVAVGVYPSFIVEGDEDQVITELARVSGRSIAEVSELIFPEEGEPDYYIPIAEVSADQFDARAGDWSELTGIFYEFYTTRLYFESGAAPHAIGYVGPIPAEQVDDYVPLGYQIDDYVGRQGVEAWGEEYLSGTVGGALYVISPEGEIVTTLAQTSAQPAASVFTTLDAELQFQAQQAIKDFDGAIVVLERDTGRVLAMVSSPDFNPNWADPFGFNSFWDSYFPDNDLRFFNRATQGQYPPGSIFKVISMAAALESEVFRPQNSYNCTHEWNGLAGITLYDWTFEKELPASGQLTLVEGLMRSCNPWFYNIGLTLYSQEFETAIADTARGFGLGSPTGIQAVAEEEGQVVDPNPDPAIGASEAVQQAIGQGSTTLTPLQAAVYAAALGNGGTLYQPYLVDRVVNTDGAAVLDFEPQANGSLPISSSTLASIQEGMRMVVTDTRGTAYRRFTGFSIPVYGKTGTASVTDGDPHAWFIGYTDRNAGEDALPDIAIAVLVENIGDGSEFAAPIFRRLASYYFFGTAGPLYPWESDYGVLDPAYFDETLQEEETQPTDAAADGGDDNGPTQVTPSP